MKKHPSPYPAFVPAAPYGGGAPEPLRVAPATGQSYQWIGQTGDLGAASNWLNTGNPGVSAEPDAGDTGFITYGQDLYGTLTIGALIVAGDGSTPISFGSAGDQTAISAAALTLAGPVQFSDYAAATSENMTIQGNTVADDSFILVQDFATEGSFQIEASSTPSSLLLTDDAFLGLGSVDAEIGAGAGGSATLTLADAAYASAGGGFIALGDTSDDPADGSGSGTLIVTDPDTQAFLNDDFAVGGDGQGAILVENGAYASMGSQNGGVVGNNATAGTITVTGAGSLLSVQGGLTSGSAGTLAVYAGGMMQTDSDADVDGSLLVTGQRSVFSARELTLDSDSRLMVQNGGTVNGIDISNSGTSLPFQLEGGTLTAHNYIADNTSAAEIEGYGAINARYLAYFADIAAEGGRLVVNAETTHIAAMSAAVGSILDLRQGGELDNVSGGGTLQLEAAANDYDYDPGPLTVGTVLLNGGASLYLDDVLSSSNIVDNGTLTILANTGSSLSGKLSGTGSVVVQGNAGLLLTAAGTLTDSISGAGLLQLGGATLLGKAVPSVANLIVLMGGSLSGAGTLSSAIADQGTIAAAGGTLVLAGGMSEPITGVLSAAAGAVLDIASAGTLAGPIAGAGTLQLDAATLFAPHAALSVGSVIDTANIGLGAGENLTNAAGHGFAIRAGSATALALGASASNTFTNAGTLAAAGAGTVTIGATFNNTGIALLGAASLSFAGDAANSGTMSATGAVLFNKAVTGTGTLAIGAGGTLSLLAGTAAGQHLDFLAATGTLDLTKPATLLGTIAGFAGSDVIDLVKTPATALAYAAGTLIVKSGATAEASLHFSGAYSAASFAIGSDGHGGSLITFV